MDKAICIIELNGGKECKEICSLCIERQKSILLEEEQAVGLMEVNSLFRSFHAIIEREGKNTNWDAIKKKVERVLKIQHRMMYPNQYLNSNESGAVSSHEQALGFLSGFEISIFKNTSVPKGSGMLHVNPADYPDKKE